MTKQLVLAGLVAIAAASAGAATAAATTNPLHPAYYAAKVDPAGWMGTRAGSGEVYRDSANPLYPGYRLSAADQLRSLAANEVFRDLRNPLYPSYGQ